MASRSPAGKTPPRKAPGPQPAHILFRVGRQGYLLTRRFERPQWARLQDAHEEHARNLLARAARENIAFAGRLRTTFAADVAPLGQRADAAGVIGNVATLIGRHRLFLFRLGEAPTAQPRRVSELRMDVIPASPVPPDSDAAPAPRDLSSRMLIVVEGMREVPPRELGEDALELIAVLATAGAALRIAAALAAWIAANFTPIGWIADAAMIGYGVWTVGIGFIDAMRRLLIVARDIQAARTRGDLKRLSAPLAKLLVEAGLTAMLAFFLKGLSKAKRGSGAGGKDTPGAGSQPRRAVTPAKGAVSDKSVPGRQTGAGSGKHAADEAYDAIRASKTDVESIAKNTGYKPENIQKVKDHIFNNEHLLDRYEKLGIPAERARFDSDQLIADAWKRLEAGTHGPGDITLLKHEIAEAWYMKNVAPGYDAAHTIAHGKYPVPGH